MTQHVTIPTTCNKCKKDIIDDDMIIVTLMRTTQHTRQDIKLKICKNKEDIKQIILCLDCGGNLDALEGLIIEWNVL